MANKEKKSVTVSISQLENAFPDTDLSEFEAEETYPMPKLLDALRSRLGHDIKPRGDFK